MPAFAAGEPSIGEMITKRFLRFSTSMPMPSISSLPSVSFLRRAVLLRVHEARVRIEHVGQAARGAVHEIGLRDVLDVVGLDVREHLREHAELLVRVEAPGGQRPREDQPAREGGEHEQATFERSGRCEEATAASIHLEGASLAQASSSSSNGAV